MKKYFVAIIKGDDSETMAVHDNYEDARADAVRISKETPREKGIVYVFSADSAESSKQKIYDVWN